MDLDVWRIIWMPIAGAGIAAFGVLGGKWIDGWFQARAARPTIQAAAAKAATDAQTALIEGMKAFVNELQEERKELISEVRSQRTYIDALANKVTELSSHIDSLERLMRDKGLTPPPRPGWGN